jgi:hypothetical protein
MANIDDFNCEKCEKLCKSIVNSRHLVVDPTNGHERRRLETHRSNFAVIGEKCEHYDTYLCGDIDMIYEAKEVLGLD